MEAKIDTETFSQIMIDSVKQKFVEMYGEQLEKLSNAMFREYISRLNSSDADTNGFTLNDNVLALSHKERLTVMKFLVDNALEN